MKVRITHNATASGYLAFFFEHAGYLAAVTNLMHGSLSPTQVIHSIHLGNKRIFIYFFYHF
jgi:hypothetical protein